MITNNKPHRNFHSVWIVSVILSQFSWLTKWFRTNWSTKFRNRIQKCPKSIRLRCRNMEASSWHPADRPTISGPFGRSIKLVLVSPIQILDNRTMIWMEIVIKLCARSGIDSNKWTQSIRSNRFDRFNWMIRKLVASICSPTFDPVPLFWVNSISFCLSDPNRRKFTSSNLSFILFSFFSFYFYLFFFFWLFV